MRTEGKRTRNRPTDPRERRKKSGGNVPES